MNADPRMLALVSDATAAEIVSAGPIREGLRASVWRCTVRAPTGRVSTVIAKQLSEESDLGLTDWAALAFLGADAASARLAPASVGGSAVDRVVILEDLGAGGTLETLLDGTDPAAAHRALLDLGECYGRLHSATLGREAEFDAVCATIPGSRPTGRAGDVETWLDGLARARAWMTAVGAPEPGGLGAACAWVAETARSPGAFLAFTHGDPAPSNNHVAERGEVRLLDFEYGAYRHALYDMSAWEVLCPLPRRILDEMLARYRATSPPIDDSSFRDGWAAMVAFRTLAILSWIPVETLQRNASWVGEWSRRDAVLAATGRLGAAAAGVDELAPIVELATGLHDRLTRLWPESDATDPTPSWPAFSR